MRFGVVAVPVGAILFLMGLIWFLQGIGILPGSIMTGSTFWAGAGGLTVIVGLVLIATGVTGRKASSQK
ncbi:MAG: hypothetical protein ABSD99_03270 [Candidatus Bathyarchaeia archaeon]